VRRTFRANVNSYASLAAAQPVRVFVGGNVTRPGLYGGTSMDSLLHYLDQAGGIDTERGSFLAVQVKRGNTLRGTFNLYDFLLKGSMPLLQLADGDVIFVPQRQGTVKVSGLVENAKRFEFATMAGTQPFTVSSLAQIAKPLAQATHVRVVRNTGTGKTPSTTLWLKPVR
jgi:protein involved in polysaccharide export with SLBB domain